MENMVRGGLQDVSLTWEDLQPAFDFGLSDAELGCMVRGMLYQQVGLKMSEQSLVERTASSKSSVERSVKGLQEKGYLDIGRERVEKDGVVKFSGRRIWRFTPGGRGKLLPYENASDSKRAFEELKAILIGRKPHVPTVGIWGFQGVPEVCQEVDETPGHPHIPGNLGNAVPEACQDVQNPRSFQYPEGSDVNNNQSFSVYCVPLSCDEGLHSPHGLSLPRKDNGDVDFDRLRSLSVDYYSQALAPEDADALYGVLESAASDKSFAESQERVGKMLLDQLAALNPQVTVDSWRNALESTVSDGGRLRYPTYYLTSMHGRIAERAVERQEFIGEWERGEEARESRHRELVASVKTLTM